MPNDNDMAMKLLNNCEATSAAGITRDLSTKSNYASKNPKFSDMSMSILEVAN